ncbi:response regulator [Xinfangfangia sp. D13-10-4-6]|uniref:ATP-binding protein n=1 Tax=Pseudogemmobacter hezensis TaxID=2737662 RepID=UPI001557DB3B|nr:ATP-binding protein [Pseudogemmobacter hezensis]NPD15614.1 response regulator [Pseudogemmobacter hezensis]
MQLGAGEWVQTPGYERDGLLNGARGLALRSGWLVAVAAVCLILAVLVGDSGFRFTLSVTGLALVLVTLLLWGMARIARHEDAQTNARLSLLIGEDVAPCFSTDTMGQILFRNRAAIERFGDQAPATLAAQLHEQIASPSAVMYRLQSRAANHGGVHEDIVTRRGHLRLSVHRIATDKFLWRIEEFEDRSPAGRGAEALSLPMVVANRAGVVLFSNEAMRRLLGERPKRLDRIFMQPRVTSGEEVEVATAGGTTRAIVAELDGAGDRREIFLLPAPARREEDSIPVDFENVPVALMKFGLDGGMRQSNLAARELLGAREVGAMTFHDLFEDLGRPVNDWLADVIEQRLPAGAEMLRLRGGDEEHFVQVQLSRFIENGRPLALAILADVTVLKKMEAQFDQSQKMQAIGQLTGGIAHDFNNLLTAISGHCDLLLLRHGQEDSDFSDLEQIRQNANRAAALVSQLLAFSRKQTLRPERLDLSDVMSEVAHLLNRLVGERITLTLRNDPDLGPIRADRRRLEQVLMNLVVNARDAMAGKGTILIETEDITLTDPVTRDGATVSAGRWAVIRVSDTGCGIPPDRIGKIFEPFFTTKRPGEGTGLGLSTVYGIVKQSGGFVFVESEPDHGATFELLFPVQEGLVVDGPPAPVEDPDAPEQQRLQHLRNGAGVVLLVEDEAAVRAFASRALKMRGYTVVEAANAEEALQLLDDPAMVVDIFVSDVIMPGMDGPTWVKRALEERPDVRVVFVSGYAEDHISADQSQIPNSVFLAKPFSLNDLTATVQAQLHQA